MEEQRVRNISPEERQRRIELRRKRKRKAKIINTVFASLLLVTVIVFTVSLVNYIKYSIPNGSADSTISKAKEAIASAETQIQDQTPEKEALEKEIESLKEEYAIYNDD